MGAVPESPPIIISLHRADFVADDLVKKQAGGRLPSLIAGAAIAA
jgi:hypothetical protein